MPEIASDTKLSSYCLIAEYMPIRVAPGPDVDDPGNIFDTDATTAEKIEHNTRLRWVCNE